MAKKGRKDKARKQAQRAGSEAKAGTSASDQPVRAPEPSPGDASQATATAEAATAEPAARSRVPTNAFIALFLVYQLAMPLRYYLGGRGYDERFSWRMFSTVRMQECKVRVEERVGDETRYVDLDKALQIAWIGMLERYRRPVVDKFLGRRCDEPGVHEVHYQRNCTDTDGSALPATHVRLNCSSGQLTTEQEPQGALP